MHEAPWPGQEPIPPGTPEARAAIERVKRALAEESRMLATFTIPGARRTRRQPPRACRTCQRPVRTPGEEYCYRHRPTGPQPKLQQKKMPIRLNNQEGGETHTSVPLSGTG